MGADFLHVKQNTYDNWADAQDRSPRGNRRGELVVCDFWTQLLLDGRMFHMQMGAETTPINSTVNCADTLVWALIDGAAGTTYVPALYEVCFEILTDATLIEAYLEIDRAKARYNTGGNAYVPENLRTDRPRASVVAAAYVGTDVGALAKTAVPGSIEIGHHMFMEDAIASAAALPMRKYELNARNRPLPVVVGVGSILCHFGVDSGTNDTTGFGSLEWAEIPTESAT